MIKNKWIDEDIVIDFDLPDVTINLIQDLEQLAAQNHYGYINYIDRLDNQAKGLYSNGKITKEQWYRLLQKYGGIYNE